MGSDVPRWLASLQLAAVQLLDAWPTKLGASLLLALWGPYQEAYGALLIAMCVDFATGVVAAARKHTLSSAVGKQKAVVKLLSYAAVLIAVYQLERALASGPFAWGSDFTLSAALLYLIGTEVISILENVEQVSGRRLRVFSGHKDIARHLRGDDEKGDGTPRPRP